MSGVYCPNCGIEISRLEYDIPSNFQFDYSRENTKKKGQNTAWTYTQVPFPNAKRLKETDKPVAVLSRIKI